MERILTEKERKMDAVLFFDVSDEEILARLERRRSSKAAPTTIPPRWRPGSGPTGSRPRRSSTGTSARGGVKRIPAIGTVDEIAARVRQALADSMITLKSPREIEIMARAGQIVAGTLALMRETCGPGMTTEDLDAAAERFIRSHDGCVAVLQGSLRLSQDALYLDR